MLESRSGRILGGLLALCLLGSAFDLSGGAPAATPQPETLADYAQTAVKDFSGRTRVLEKHKKALKELGSSFVRAYSIKTQLFYYKEPGKVRLEARQGLARVRLITNGNQHLAEYRLGPGLTKRDRADLRLKPGKGDTSVNFGIVAPSFPKRVQSKFLRFENRGGKRAAVFSYWYPADPKLKHTLVLDPETRIVLEHTAHHRNKKLPGFKNRYVFSSPRKIAGVWLPTRIELRSPSNQLAAVSAVENLQVNTGLPDKLFDL